MDYFVKKFGEKYHRRIKGVSAGVIAAFSNYDWPGNIRELENVLERMAVMSEGDVLNSDLLPPEIQGFGLPVDAATLKEKVDTISRVSEKQMIMDALNKCDQNRTRAAELLGISRRTLQNKIKEYSL